MLDGLSLVASVITLIGVVVEAVKYARTFSRASVELGELQVRSNDLHRLTSVRFTQLCLALNFSFILGAARATCTSVARSRQPEKCTSIERSYHSGYCKNHSRAPEEPPREQHHHKSEQYLAYPSKGLGEESVKGVQNPKLAQRVQDQPDSRSRRQ